MSYPTVRLRFGALLRAIDYDPSPEAQEVREERTDILGLLELCELTTAETAKRLQVLKR